MSNSKIRSANAKDLADIKKVIDATALFPSEYLDDMFSSDTDPRDAKEFWLVFDDDGVQAVAYCAPEQMTNGTWNLLLIAVHPDDQNQGIGKQLMLYVEQALKGLGVRVLLVETSGTTEFSRTRSFYEKIGYNNEACIRDYYDDGDDKIVFHKSF